MNRFKLALIVVVLLIASGVQASASILPEPTGDYAVGTTTRHLVDPARDDRELMVQIWYPAERVENPVLQSLLSDELIPGLVQGFGLPENALMTVVEMPTPAMIDAPLSDTQSAYPVLLFSHGWGSTRFANSTQFIDLASHGYIVVAIDHTDYAMAVKFPDGRIKAFGFDPLDMNTVMQALPVWVADQEFVLDQLAAWNTNDAALAGRLDLEHIGAFGHSFGGTISAIVCQRDIRCDAAIDMDGSLLFPEIQQTVLTKPFMFLNQDVQMVLETTTDEMLASYGLTRDQFEAQMQAVEQANGNVFLQATGDTYYLRVAGSDHHTFTDQGLIAPPPGTALDGTRGVEITHIYTQAFFDQYLKNQPSPLLVGPSTKYPEALWMELPTTK